MTLIGEAFVAASRGESPVHRGVRSDRFAPQGAYRAAGEDEWVVVSVRSDVEWERLCDAIDLDIGSPLRAYRLKDRRENHDQIDAVISEWMNTRGPQLAMEVLQSKTIPAGRVLYTTSILEDRQLNDREYWIEIPHPQMHAYRQQGNMWPLVTARAATRRHSPLFGEHNTEILQGELGLTDDQLAELTTALVIARAPINPSVG